MTALSSCAVLDLQKTRESGFEHFCRTVSPRRWHEVLVQMLTGCFDAGGKETDSHNVIVVAGFASFARVWEEFEERWLERLGKEGLKYFHAGELAQFQGEFREGWKNDEPRRRALCGDLLSIISDCGLRKFGASVALEDYELNKASFTNHPAAVRMNAFALAATVATDEFYTYAVREGVQRNVRCVFEKGDPEDALRGVFRGSGYVEPHFAWKTDYTDRKGIKHDPFLGLRAAGWIAYEYYLSAQRFLSAKDATERWPLLQFEALPGQIIPVQFIPHELRRGRVQA